jgi:PAS domain S-box-containing protein
MAAALLVLGVVRLQARNNRERICDPLSRARRALGLTDSELVTTHLAEASRSQVCSRVQPASPLLVLRSPCRPSPRRIGRAPEKVVLIAYARVMGAVSEEVEWERLFWLVFERTSNPIILLDDKRQIVEANDSAFSLFGADRQDLVCRSMADRIRPEERSVSASEWEEFLGSGEYSGTRTLVRTDGAEVRIDFAARMAVIEGRRLAIYVVARDDPSCLPSQALAGHLPLTDREREVITLIALGRETAEIAEELHISPETVRTHVRNAMSRLGAHTRAQLVAIALCTDQAVHGSRLTDA